MLQEVVEGYEAITGTKVRAPRQRNLIAACYRVHGDDFVPFARDYVRVEGTAQNLLGVLRTAPPRSSADDTNTEVELPDEPIDLRPEPSRVYWIHDGPPCPPAERLFGKTYCARHRPAR